MLCGVLQYGYYPSYHTAYDTYEYVLGFVDPSLQYHRAMTQLSAELLRSLLDRPLLPFDLRDYASLLQEQVTDYSRLMLLVQSQYFDQDEGRQLRGTNTFVPLCFDTYLGCWLDLQM